MRAKEKTKKRIKITLKRTIYFFVTTLIILYMAIFYNIYFKKNEVFAKETSANVQEKQGKEEFKISRAEKINVENIIEENTKSKPREEYVTEQVELEYITKYQDNSSLPKGTIQVIQEGREGKQEITKKRVYQNEEMILEEQVGAKITKASINKIVEVGSGAGKVYKAKVGESLYVTSDRLSVRREMNEQADKVTTLAKGNEIKLLETQGEWYKISYKNITGYVKKESTAAKNANIEEIPEIKENSKPKGELTGNLNFNMALNKPSGLTLEQFKKVLSDGKDKNNTFANNAQYFYYIEKQYNINGLFVAAVGIHESDWGTSKISREKNNLFGYGAYDSNPYNGAYSFSDYSECIDLIARVFVKYYLNPKGTSIYGGEKATGTYYNGPTLTGINTKYATDKNWANGVYSHMKYLYNKL